MGVLMLQLLLPVIVAGLGWLLHRRLRHHPDVDRNAVLERTFAVLPLPLQDGGQIAGQRGRVVKRPTPLSTSTFLLSTAAGYQEGHGEEFWYCVGDGGHYWMAIANCERQWWRWRVHWVVRPLTAARMRNALIDDPAALQATFGDVQIDRFYA